MDNEIYRFYSKIPYWYKPSVRILVFIGTIVMRLMPSGLHNGYIKKIHNPILDWLTYKAYPFLKKYRNKC